MHFMTSGDFSTTFGRRLTGRGGIDQNQRLQKLLISLYALFFYLSWFQKKQKLPTTSWVMNKSETLGIHYRVSQVYSLLLDGFLDVVYFVA